MLLKVNYKEGNYHIGDLNNLIGLKSDLIDEEIRDISQMRIDISRLIDTLSKNKDKIEDIQFCLDESLLFIYDGKEIGLEQCFKNIGIQTEKLSM
jgi:CRISPR-associated protein Csh2